MTPAASTPPQPRGRPRSEKAHEAILAAAAELLLARGLGAVSMDTVAEQAGVSKATIYRWWPTKETLALTRSTTSGQRQVRLLGRLARCAATCSLLLRPLGTPGRQKTVRRVIAGLVAEAQADPVFAEQYRERFVEPRRAQARPILQRARSNAASRRPRPTSNSRSTCSTARSTTASCTATHLNDRLLRDLIDTVLAGLRAAGRA
jgi:AcrR family transcriptional regulator